MQLDFFEMPLRDKNLLPLSNITQVFEHGGIEYTYNRNSDGFRCDNFKNNPYVLFAGCSETFGESADYETTWAYKTYLKLKDQVDGFYNLGLPGIDSSIVIFQVLQFIEKYGKPEYLFIIFPQFNRLIEFHPENVTTTVTLTESIPDNIVNPDNLEETTTRTINAVRALNLMSVKNFESFCEMIGIKLIWGTWCLESHKIIKQEKSFSNYVDILNYENMTDFFIKNNIAFNNTTMSRSDGNHHGEPFHRYWSHIFYSKFLESQK